MSDPRTQLVGAGYDVIGEQFVEWCGRIVDDPRDWWAEQLSTRLPDGAHVLELGCGAGVHDTKELATRFRVTGVDISPEQIRRARNAVPHADFRVADFTALELEPASYDAVASFYAFNHVPRERLADLLTDVRSWLVPGGYLLTAFGAGDTEGWTGQWLGTTMYFSSFPPETNSRLVDEAGFERLLDEVVTLLEPEGPATFQWVLAQR
jgi:cyclopropane fatty-acyl-phospholipid synthase-like methyltransferase